MNNIVKVPAELAVPTGDERRKQQNQLVGVIELVSIVEYAVLFVLLE